VRRPYSGSSIRAVKRRSSCGKKADESLWRGFRPFESGFFIKRFKTLRRLPEAAIQLAAACVTVVAPAPAETPMKPIFLTLSDELLTAPPSDTGFSKLKDGDSLLANAPSPARSPILFLVVSMGIYYHILPINSISLSGKFCEFSTWIAVQTIIAPPSKPCVS
jgi:nitrate reductase NapE component